MAMHTTIDVHAPERLPFLQAICWQTADVRHFTPEEALARYERGWNYRGVLEDLGAEESNFVRTLAQAFGSWLHGVV